MGLVIKDYLIWHFGSALKDLNIIFGNIVWFIYHFFSMAMMMRTFFRPFKRIEERYTHLDLGEIFEHLIVNTLMRFVGIVFRSFLLFMGVIVELLVITFWPIAILLWITLPALILCFASFSLISLFINV